MFGRSKIKKFKMWRVFAMPRTGDGETMCHEDRVKLSSVVNYLSSQGFGTDDIGVEVEPYVIFFKYNAVQEMTNKLKIISETTETT